MLFLNVTYLGACCTLNGRPQDGPMASAFIRAEASDSERCLACKSSEECHGMLCRGLLQLPGISREEMSSNGRIVEILFPRSTDQFHARRYKRGNCPGFS